MKHLRSHISLCVCINDYIILVAKHWFTNICNLLAAALHN